MVTQYAKPTHPIVAAALTVRATLNEVAETNPVYMTPAAQADALRELVAAEAQVVELRARVMATADGVADEAGKHDTAGWLASATHLGPREARAQKRLAEALDTWPQVAAGMRTGTVNREQAEVVCHALNALPDDTEPSMVTRAEAHLVDLCHQFAPRQLRILGRQILDILDPDTTERREAEQLEAEEHTAFEKTRLSIRPLHDGTTKITLTVPDLVATRLAHILHAFTSPRHDPQQKAEMAEMAEMVDATDENVWWKLPHHRRLGHAFCEFLERLDPSALPVHGTTGTEIIVTLSLDQLRTDLAAASVIGPDSIERISAHEARRLACTAGITPAVLGSNSQPLDLGRTTRLASKAQKKALMLTHATCQAEGCDAPASWSEVHHLNPWSKGGTTNLTNLTLLCSPDHHHIHDPSYLHERFPDGTIRFTRRT